MGGYAHAYKASIGWLIHHLHVDLDDDAALPLDRVDARAEVSLID
jgi:hypothetical protein